MELVVINKRDGTKIQTYNRLDSAEQVKEFLGQDVVNISLRSPVPIKFDVGDWLEVFGERYTINLLPQERKNNDRLFEYTLRFEGIQYDLIKVQVLDIDDSGFATGANFALMADLEDYVKLIVRNLNRVYGTGKWIVGDVQQNTEHKLQDFTNSNCLEALQRLCDEYETHFAIEMIGGLFKLNVKTIDTLLPDTFRYGRLKGLYNLERTNVSDKNIVTRLYAFGGTTNIPGDYRGGSLRLKLPLYAIPSEAQPYITDAGAIAEFGITEGAINFEDIYPKRTGTVSGINTDRLMFNDSSMPFDLNAQLLPGLNAKINFKTGSLAGYTFDVVSYNNNTKQFKINAYTDERGFVFPSVDNNAFRISIGDTYVLTDIKMPQIYITEAEELLYDKAREQLGIQSVPAVQWALEIDSNYIKSKEIIQGQIVNYFKCGYFINVVDADLRINGKSQIVGFTRNILSHYEYKITVSEQFVNRRNIQRRNLFLEAFRNSTQNVVSIQRQINSINNNVTNSIAEIQIATQTIVAESSNFGGREW